MKFTTEMMFRVLHCKSPEPNMQSVEVLCQMYPQGSMITTQLQLSWAIRMSLSKLVQLPRGDGQKANLHSEGLKGK